MWCELAPCTLSGWLALAGCSAVLLLWAREVIRQRRRDRARGFPVLRRPEDE